MYEAKNGIASNETAALGTDDGSPTIAANPLEELIIKLDALHFSSWQAKAAAIRSGYSGRFAVPWRIIGYIWDYCIWLARAWWRVALTFSTVLLQPLNILSLLFFASAASISLFVLLLTDILLAVPQFYALYKVVNDYLIEGPLPRHANSTETSLFFAQFPKSILRSAIRGLSTPPTWPRPEDKTRVFDLEVAKLLLALSMLIYERDPRAYNDAMDSTPRFDRAALSGRSRAQHHLRQTRLRVAACDEKIKCVARECFGFQFYPLSELNTRSSAVVGAFWFEDDPSFIILAFKGTSASEFSQWITDFDYAYTAGNTWLRGYDQVHQGFYRALFPERVSRDGLLPYDWILSGTLLIAEHLQAKNGRKPVNIYTTGHSLGAALASFVYARGAQAPDDFVETSAATSSKPIRRAMLRDGYHFGTPIFGDPYSMHGFNSWMHPLPSGEPTAIERMAWRVTNHDDAVATLLPAFGDTRALGDLLSSTNQFNYAHIGEEIKLRSAPKLSQVGPGTVLPVGTPVKILSRHKHAEPFSNGSGQEELCVIVPRWLVLAQHLPLFGRLLAHSPILYAEELKGTRPTEGSEVLPYYNMRWYSALCVF